MTSKNYFPLPDSLQEALDKIGIQRRTQNLNFSEIASHYFRDQYAFLQIVAINDLPALSDPELITAPSGWVIHHYGNAMSSSPGLSLFGKRDEDDDSGREGGDATGTIYKQATITAQAMVYLAKKWGWTGIHIIDGNSLMQFVVWLEAQEEGLQCIGYKPTKKEFEKKERIRRSDTEDQIHMRKSRNKPSL